MVLLEISEADGLLHTFNDNELLSDVETDLPNLFAVHVVPAAESAHDVAIVAVNVAISGDETTKRYRK